MDAYEQSEAAANLLISCAVGMLARAEAQKDVTFRAMLDTIEAFGIDAGVFMLAYQKRLEQLKEGTE